MTSADRSGIPNAEDVQLFAPGGLERLAAYEGYREAAPFPHLVIDNIFNPDALRAVVREWPISSAVEVHDDGTYVARKVGTTWESDFGPYTRAYFAALANPAFLQVLQWVTGIHGLIPDPYMIGGGLHATAWGGKLAVHADFNKHPVYHLDRRLNLLIYLNEGWTEANGGWLELWDKNMSACATRVLPVFNRTVLFSTTDTSFHGQPEPVAGPKSLWRKSIALYYFSNGRGDEESIGGSAAHSTLWRQRPGAGY